MQPLSVELGPGILENIFDGIQVSFKPEITLLQTSFLKAVYERMCNGKFCDCNHERRIVLHKLTCLVSCLSYPATTESYCTSVSRCVHSPWSSSSSSWQEEAMGIYTKKPEYVIFFFFFCSFTAKQWCNICRVCIHILWLVIFFHCTPMAYKLTFCDFLQVSNNGRYIRCCGS